MKKLKEIKALQININPRNQGYYAVFFVDEQKYYADVAIVDFVGPECMIFAYNEDGTIDWMDLYCNRNVEVSKESLKACIDEFVESL